MRSAGRFVLGYHGCLREIGEAVLQGGSFEASDEAFDWLGPGIYFWENDARRALEWAHDKVAALGAGEPMVLGAVIELGRCLDLTTREDLELLSLAYESFRDARATSALPMPENRDARTDPHRNSKLRFLDCAILRHLERNIADEADEVRRRGGTPTVLPIQTVRGLFIEGAAIYPGGGFYEKTHMQIAVVDPASLRGVFLPRPPPSL